MELHRFYCSLYFPSEDTKKSSHIMDVPFSVQFSSVTQLCQTLCDRVDCSTPGFPVHHQLPELAQTLIYGVSDAIQPLILCHPLLLPPSIFPSIRVFSNEPVLCIRWSKYWCFSFSISPSNEYSGLISFRNDFKRKVGRLDFEVNFPIF